LRQLDVSSIIKYQSYGASAYVELDRDYLVAEKDNKEAYVDSLRVSRYTLNFNTRNFGMRRYA